MAAEVAILDVGHGNCAVVHHQGQAIVIDTGPDTVLLEFLRDTGINRVTAVLISHADADHLKGLVALLAQPDIVVEEVYVNSDAAQRSRQWKALVYELDDRDRRGECSFNVGLIEGQEFELEPDVVVDILAPRSALAATGPGSNDNQGRRITTNSISAVARVSVSAQSVLFAGDIDEVGLSHLLMSGKNLRSDTLVFPHHGGNVSPSATEAKNRDFTRRLLQAVGPSTVVFSIGRSRFGNPRPEIVSEVTRSKDRSVMCTQMSNHCSSADRHEVSHLSDAFSSGKHKGLCCAGSVLISGVGWSPTKSEHALFVDVAAPTALCRPGKAAPT